MYDNHFGASSHLFTVIPCALTETVAFFITETLHHAPCAGRGVAPSAATASQKPEDDKQQCWWRCYTIYISIAEKNTKKDQRRYMQTWCKKSKPKNLKSNFHKLSHQNVSYAIVPNTPSGHGCWLPRDKMLWTFGWHDDIQTSWLNW